MILLDELIAKLVAVRGQVGNVPVSVNALTMDGSEEPYRANLPLDEDAVRVEDGKVVLDHESGY